jgi:hypothetical protein
MAEWNETETSVKTEREDLAFVLDRISQMPKRRAERILMFCNHYIKDDVGDKVHPSVQDMYSNVIEKILAEKNKSAV